MAEGPVRALTSRRRLLRRGMILPGAAAAAALPATVRAQEGEVPGILERVLERGRVVVGTGDAGPPWHFKDETGDFAGFDVELARILARGLFGDPAKVEFVVQAAEERVPNLRDDRVDVVFQGMTVDPRLAQQVEFTIPYYRESLTLLFRSDSVYNDAAQMRGKRTRVGVLAGGSAEEAVRKGVPEAEVLTYSSVAEAVRGLDDRRVDAVAIALSTAQRQTTLAPDRYKVASDAWRPRNYAAAVKRGHHLWLGYVNTVLREALTGGEFEAYAAAFKRYFNVDLPPPPSGFPVR